MPILNFRLEAKTAEGATVPGSIGLQHFGLRVPVVVGIHGLVEKACRDQEIEIPQPISGHAVLDTGATVTSIDETIAQRLQLTPNGVRRLATASGPMEATTYAFRLRIANALTADCPQGVGCNLSGQGIIVLLGMDLLSRCILIVNGPDGSFSLAM